MKTKLRLRGRASLIFLPLVTLLLTACHITVVPLRAHDFFEPGEKAFMLMHRHHNEGDGTVQAALTAYQAALNAIFTGAVEPMQAVWSHADDVTYMGPDGAYRKGWPAVLADWQGQAAMNLGGRVEFEDVQIVTGRNLAVVHNTVQGANLDAAGNEVEVSLRATVILRKEAGEWKVIGVQTDPLPRLQN